MKSGNDYLCGEIFTDTGETGRQESSTLNDSVSIREGSVFFTPVTMTSIKTGCDNPSSVLSLVLQRKSPPSQRAGDFGSFPTLGLRLR